MGGEVRAGGRGMFGAGSAILEGGAGAGAAAAAEYWLVAELWAARQVAQAPQEEWAASWAIAGRWLMDPAGDAVAPQEKNAGAIAPSQNDDYREVFGDPVS